MINLVDWEKREDEVVACSGTAAAVLGRMQHARHSLSGWVTLHNQPLHLQPSRRGRSCGARGAGWLTQAGIHSAALAPLTIKDRVAGTLVLLKEAGNGGFDRTPTWTCSCPSPTRPPSPSRMRACTRRPQQVAASPGAQPPGPRSARRGHPDPLLGQPDRRGAARAVGERPGRRPPVAGRTAPA